MSAAASGLIGPWGDRTYLLPKDMGYVLSLYLKAVVNGRYLTVQPHSRGLSHLFDEVVVTTPDGLRCDVPIGDVTGGTGEIGSPDDPSSIALQLRLQLTLNRTEKLLMDCTGVANFYGGRAALSLEPDLLAGSAFIATRHETDSPTFRWFNRRQLFGMGRVQGIAGSRPRELEFSFDLYAGA
jgi:hypothetical protein